MLSSDASWSHLKPLDMRSAARTTGSVSFGNLPDESDPFERIIGEPDMLARRTSETDMMDDCEIIEAQLLDRRLDQRPQIRHAGGRRRRGDEVLHDGKTVVALRSSQVADEGHLEFLLHFGSA